MKVRVPQLLPRWVGENLDHFRVLNHAAQTSNTFLGAGGESTYRSGKGTENAGTAGYSFHIPSLFDDLLNQQTGQPIFADVDEEPVWPGDDIRALLGFYMVAVI
jgi:hypothetical protein